MSQSVTIYANSIVEEVLAVFDLHMQEAVAGSCPTAPGILPAVVRIARAAARIARAAARIGRVAAWPWPAAAGGPWVQHKHHGVSLLHSLLKLVAVRLQYLGSVTANTLQISDKQKCENVTLRFNELISHLTKWYKMHCYSRCSYHDYCLHLLKH